MSMTSLKSSKSLKSSQVKSGSGTTHGYTMLMIRVEEGDLNGVKEAIQKYPNEGINDQNKHGLTALSLAARSGNYPIAEYLISQGADVNLPNKTNQTPLFVACSYDQLEIVKLLLKHGAQVNVADTRGWTPLMSGCQNSNVTLVELLLKHNADVRPIDRFGKRARERTKDPRITLLLDEMERRIEMLEENNEHTTPQKQGSRSRSRGSTSRRSLNELPLESARGDAMSLSQLPNELIGSQDLDSTLRACPQFVSDMEIYKMHKRAGYYDYHKSRDPRKLTSSNTSLLGRSGNDLLTTSSRGRPLTNREKGSSNLNDSKASFTKKTQKKKSANKRNNGPDSTHSLKTNPTPYANLNTDSSYEKEKSGRRQEVIDALLKEHKKPTNTKSVGSLDEDFRIKSVLKSPKRRIIDELNLSVHGEGDNDEVLNDEIKDLFRLFVKKLAERAQNVMNKKVNNKVNQEAEAVSEDRLQEIISEVGEDLEDRTINSFKTLIADLMVSFDLDDNISKILEQGTEALVNRVTALAEDETYQNIIKQGEPIPQGEQYNIIPSLQDALLADKEGKTGVNQLRGDVQDKIDEIFDLINRAFSNKSEKEKEELLNKLRPEIIGTLDALKSRVNKILQSQSDLAEEQDNSDEIDIVMVDHAKPYNHESLNELDLADTTALRSTNPTLDTVRDSKKSAIKVQNICAGDVESDQSSPAPVNVDDAYIIKKQIIHAGEVESDKQSPATINNEDEVQEERIYTNQSERNTDDIREIDEDLENQDEENDRLYEESELFMRRGTEEDGDGFFERTITRESEVLYTLEDGQTGPQQMEDTEAYIRKEREAKGLERTITRDSEVLYRFDEESQVQEVKNKENDKEAAILIEEGEEETQELIEAEEESRKESSNEQNNLNAIQKENVEDNQAINKSETQEDNLQQKKNIEAQIEDKQEEDEEVNEIVFERDTTIEELKGKDVTGRIIEAVNEANSPNKCSALIEESDNQDKENQSQLANNNIDNNAGNTIAIGKEPIQNLGKATISQCTLNDINKPIAPKNHFMIPKPTPSRFVKEVVKARIDEIPFCENFHYPGQSHLRSQSMVLPKRSLIETSVTFEEMTVIKAVN